MTGLKQISEARYRPEEIVKGVTTKITQERVNRLAPLISCSQAAIRTLMRNSLSDEDLMLLLWIEVSLRDPKPREEIVRRLLGRIHTRERNRVMKACLSEEGRAFAQDLSGFRPFGGSIAIIG